MRIHSFFNASKLILSFIMLLSPFSFQAMERDYEYDGFPIDDLEQEPTYIDEEGIEYYLYASNELCKKCLWAWGSDKVDISAIPCLKRRQIYNWPNYKSCGYCFCGEPFYSGYLHFMFNNDFPFLKKQINYTKKYPNFQAYWPETSAKAEKINNMAVKALKNLFNETKLDSVWESKELLDNFITSSREIGYWDYRKSFTYKSLAATAFRFSDYYLIFDKLKLYSQQWFSQEESEKISLKLEKVLDSLSPKFLDIYEESLALHWTKEIQEEYDFIHLLYEKNFGQSERQVTFVQQENKSQNRIRNRSRMQRNLSANEKHQPRQKENPSNYSDSCQPDWFLSEYYLLLGSNYNNVFLHAEAINALNECLRLDPTKIDAYKERAHAYFELNEVDLAIKDYWKCKELENQQPPYIKNFKVCILRNGCSKGNVEYGTGFCIGICEGGGVSLVEFVPSTFSCCRGILHGLWSFACSPNEVSKEVIQSSLSLIEFLKTHSTRESLEVVVPELKDLLSNWEGLTDFEKGQKTGYIIGKYGVDILLPAGALKGIKKFRQLKRANTMFTVECCALSEVKKTKIIKKSSEHAAIRRTVCEAVKSGRVIPRNANVIPHVMQEKHNWNRLIRITGNQKEDFQKVVRLLEESKILTKGHREFFTSFFHDGKKVDVYIYSLKIDEHIVEAYFTEYFEGKEIFLSNGWVKN